MTRSPIVAGTFYEVEPAACRRAVEQLFEAAERLEAPQPPANCVGGLVPHAGWVCSGPLAALTLKALAGDRTDGTFVLLGAVHAPTRPAAMVYDRGSWRSPLGEIEIDADLAGAIVDGCEDVEADCRAHGREHSLEVQVPLIQHLCPAAKIVPILVPPYPQADDIGRQVGRVLASRRRRPVVVGSTDLTHYGPRYGVTAAGVGPEGVAWAMQNDRNLLKIIEAMAAEHVVGEASRRHSACGGGAIAATIAACAALGAEAGTVLHHTNSVEMLKDAYPGDASNSVGYASVVFA